MSEDFVKENVTFIAKVANYVKEHGNKYDKKFIEDAVWDIAAVYKNEGKNEVAEYLITQVTDCVAFVPQGE